MTDLGRTDLGLRLAGWMLPLSAFVGTRFTSAQRRRYRRILTSAARGEQYQPDTLGDTLSNSTQGLGGAAVFCGLLAALFVWLESLVWYPVFAALAAVAGGALALLGTLATIYGVRSAADRPVRQLSRRADLWYAAAAGVLMATMIAVGRFAP